jgi:transposase
VGLKEELPAWLEEGLLIYRRLILAVEEELQGLQRAIEATAASVRPRGLGALTLEQVDREVCDWSRFKNRKAVGSYAGLVGAVSASGTQRYEGSITKAGNQRLRTILVELAWRWVVHQSSGPLVQRWRGVLLNPRAPARARKKAIVAVARRLLIDLWRWRTGRATPEGLGWRMLAAA